MLPKKGITKRQKKERSKKKIGSILIVSGLFFIAVSLFFTVFLEKKPLYLNPLSKNQTSVNSIIEKKLKEKHILYEFIETTDDLNFIIKLKDSSQVIIDSSKDIEEQISSLQLILQHLKIEGKSLRRLDFRYQKPIISF